MAPSAFSTGQTRIIQITKHLLRQAEPRFMDSITIYDIPAVIIALLGVPLLLFGGWLGMGTLLSTNHNDWVMVTILIVICSVFAGLAAILFGVWFIREREFRRPMAIFSGILTVGFLRLIEILEFVEILRYDAAVQLLIVSVPVLVWVLLRGLELRWEINFSQRMD